MKNIRDERGVIAVAITFILIITAVLGAMIAMQRTRAPMAAMSLKRIQAQNYAEAAIYETFNRFRMNTPPYNQWKPATWNDATGTGRPTTAQDGNGNILVVGGNPVVRFVDGAGNNVDVLIDCRTVAGRTQVSASVANYNNIGLRRN